MTQTLAPIEAAVAPRPHQEGRPGQCVAKAKRTGQRCARQAIAGGTVCRAHGGAAPAVKAAAARRLAERDAAATLAALVPRDAPPVADVAGELGRLAGELVVARETAAAMVSRLTSITDPLGTPKAELRLWLDLVDRCASLLGNMARLGLDARQAEVTAGQIKLVHAMFRVVIDWALTQIRDPDDRRAVANGWAAVAAAALRQADAEGADR